MIGSIKKRAVFCVTAYAVFCTGTASADQYLCVPDKAVGFAYNAASKEWVSTQFKTDIQYIIAPAKNGRDAFAWTQVGEKQPDGYFKDDFNEAGILFGNIFGGDVKFNKNNGRYLILHSPDDALISPTVAAIQI